MNLHLTNLRAAIAKGTCRLPALPPSAQAFLGCELLREEPRAQLWIADSLQGLEKLADSFRTLCPQTTLLTLPPFDEKDMETQSERLKTLAFLQRGEDTTSTFFLLTTFQTLEEKLPNIGNAAILKYGDATNPDELFQTLEKQGYTLDVEIYEKGFAARRGGIIDVWPPTAPLPVRIEFFGDEIESLRTFDPDTQRSVEKIERVEIFPLNAKGDATLTELLPKNTLRICSSVEDKCDIQIGCVTSDVLDIDLGFYETNLKPVSELHRPDMAEQQRKVFFQTLKKMGSEGWAVDIYLETPGALNRLREAYLTTDNRQLTTAIRLKVGLLHGSFISKLRKHIIITEADIYGYQPKTAHVRRGEKAVKTAGVRVAEWTDIQPGELVVHVDHGIGKYMGLMEMEMADRRQEMLLIEYAEGARIYLPTGQAHLLTRYVGMGNSAPGKKPTPFCCCRPAGRCPTIRANGLKR